MRHALLFIIVAVFVTVLTVGSAAAGKPTAKADGTPWRIGYYEGGHYKDYVPVTKATIARLIELGWIENPDRACLDKAEKSQEIWACLQHSQGPYLEFVKDAYWSADWDKDARAANKKAYMERAAAGDIDLMLALGTWAGQDMANNEHSVPTVVCSTSNPLSAGIIKSAEDSGFDHIHARYDPKRYGRQVQLFHEAVGFKTLGIVFEDSKEGRSYAGVDQIEPVANERGFVLKICHAPFTDVEPEEASARVLECHEKLAPEVDAIYITSHRGVTKDSIADLLEPLFEHKVPSFAMGTLYEVNAGAMMSMAQPDFKYAGDFYGDVAIRILKGEKARDIAQVFPDPQEVRINLKAAELIDFHFPLELMADADEILEEIETVKE